MDFSLTEKQKMIQSMARELLSKECTSALVRKMEEDKLGYSPELWNTMAGLGWMRLPFTEECAGDGGGFFDLMLLVAEMGRVLLPSPFIPTMTGSLSIMNFGREEQKKALLPSIGNGELSITVAFYEPNLKLNKDSVVTRAEPTGDNFVLTGSKVFVSDLQAADLFLCPARTPKGITVFILDVKSPGIKAEPLATIAYDKQWDMFLGGVSATRQDVLGEEGMGWEVMEKILQWGTCLLCAYMAGACQRVVEMATDYGKQRIQFGKPIATFQATTHRLVDMLLVAEGAQLITYEAAWKLSQGLSAGFEVAAAKAFTGTAFHRITEDAMRVYGAAGSDEQCDIQLYYRKATALAPYLGDSYFHQEKVAQLMGM